MERLGDRTFATAHLMPSTDFRSTRNVFGCKVMLVFILLGSRRSIRDAGRPRDKFHTNEIYSFQKRLQPGIRVDLDLLDKSLSFLDALLELG